MEHDELPPTAGDTAAPLPAVALDPAAALDEASHEGMLIEIEESLTIELVALAEPDHSEPDHSEPERSEPDRPTELSEPTGPAAPIADGAAFTEADISPSDPPLAEAAMRAPEEDSPAPPPEAELATDTPPATRAESAPADEGPIQIVADQDTLATPLAASDPLSDAVEPEAFAASTELAAPALADTADADLAEEREEAGPASTDAETEERISDAITTPSPDAAAADLAEPNVAAVALADEAANSRAEPDANAGAEPVAEPVAEAEADPLVGAVPADDSPAPVSAEEDAPLPETASAAPVAAERVPEPAHGASPATTEAISASPPEDMVLPPPEDTAASPPGELSVDVVAASPDDSSAPVVIEPDPFALAVGTAPPHAEALPAVEPLAPPSLVDEPLVPPDVTSVPAPEAELVTLEPEPEAAGAVGTLTSAELPEALAAPQSAGEPSLRIVEALRQDMRATAALRYDPHAATTHRSPRRPRAPRRHRLALTVSEILLVLLVSFAGTFVALDAHARLNQARLLAHDGLQHLEDVRTLFAVPDKFAAALNTTTLARAQSDLTAAQGDFARLRVVLQQGTFGIGAHTPFASGPITAAANLAAAADEACQGGLFALHGVQLAAPIVAGGIFSSSKPSSSASTLTTSTVTQLTAALDGALQHLDAAVAYAQQANLAALPASLVSAQQRQQLQEAIAQWPSLRPLVLQARGFLAGVPALLGLSSPANYLIELMDRTELRPGGGFIGNYAVMSLANGKIQPFTISDTYLLDKPYLSAQGGQVQAPAAFSWWRWASFYGLRDSNYSADFPTTAQAGMRQLAREGGPKTQGVIALTVPAIARVLQVTGDVSMPQYNLTVTSQNLEYLIHYYQEAVGHDPLTGLPRSDLLSSSRKRFTALLARTLLDKLHGLSSAQLLAIGKGVLTSLRLKEIQVYVTVPQAESLLTQYGLDGGVSHGPGDGVSIVDANATANKANQFVTVTYRDSVTMDSQGTANHQLTITYNFNVSNPSQLFGQDLYEDYLRIYTPPGAQLTHLDGLHNTFGQDQINRSDLSWRQMWGGYILVQDGTPYVLHVSWRVPHAATRDAKGNWTYQVTYQHQAGANQVLILAVSVPGQRLPAIQYSATLDSDRSFTTAYHGA